MSLLRLPMQQLYLALPKLTFAISLSFFFALQLSFASATSPSLFNLALRIMVSTRATAGESSTGPTCPTTPLSTTLSTTVATTFPTLLPNAHIKLDNIKPLRGQENYEIWSTQVSLILYAIDAKSLIISGIQPDDMAADHAANLMQQALLIIIQLVTEPMLAQIASLPNAQQMWAYLRENYYSDTYFSFVHQMQVLFTLQHTTDTPITDFIRSYESEWSMLYQLASGRLMKQVLEQDEAMSCVSGFL